MKNLLVSIELNGTRIPVGRICGSDSSDACFCYVEEYIQNHGTQSISISLPVQTQPFTPEQTKTYFEGLLPEGYTRRTVAQWMHVDENDYLSILHGLGRECLGALCISEEGEILDASYEPVSDQQVRELAAEGASKSTELVTKAHLSLTGASGKVGLYYDRETNRWHLPWGTAPSTHIVKQSHVRLDGIVTNEQLCLLTAARCGIDIPKSFIVNMGNAEEHEVLFATERYDRIFTQNPQFIGGHPVPVRLHQEDFAQAMGIPASQKYETDPSGYLRRMFTILLQRSADPITDQLKLWDRIVFNCLIGNTDSHVKNFSLLYGTDLKSVRLSPAYDIVSTTIYEQSTRDMAFWIGGVLSLDDISEGSFRALAKEVGLGERMALNHFYSMRDRFKFALHESAVELSQAGYPKAAEIEQRILMSGSKLIGT